jgi:predicted membrane protein
MENQNYKTADRDSFRIGGRSKNSSVIIGFMIIVVGILLLLSKLGVFIPSWLVSWKMLLIAIGVIMGIKSGFKDIAWFVPIIIGLIFLSNDIFPGLRFGRLIWPIGLIAIGAIIIAKGNRRKFNNDFTPDGISAPTSTGFVSGFQKLDENGNPVVENVIKNQTTDDEIECVAVFGGVKRTVVSKNFMGGEIVAIFGGADIDLRHADIQGVVKLEATNILGGTKLIVPPNWDVQSEMVAIFGGVEDKRRIQPELIDRSKRLVLYGTAFLGGLEVKSY